METHQDLVCGPFWQVQLCGMPPPPPPPLYIQQGNSVARDLPPTGSEANTTIYMLDIDSHCLLCGETTFHLTSYQNSLYLLFGETSSHLTSQLRGTFQYFLFFKCWKQIQIQHKKNTKKTLNEKKVFLTKLLFFFYSKNYFIQ